MLYTCKEKSRECAEHPAWGKERWLMDIRQLTYFTAVAQNGSFSKAAEILSLSQPTLSLAVKKLEEELGVKLFYSFNKRQELTDEGRALLESSRHLLDVYQQTLENVKTSSKSCSGTFVLGLSPLFGACFFGDLIPKFHEEYPNIQITMIEDGARKIDERIASGQVDLAVTLKTDRLATFHNCHFTTQRNVALLNRSHPLAGEKSITVSQLRDDAFAIFSQDFILHRQIMSACHSAGFRPKIALLSSQWDFMVELVAKNHAVSILPKPVLDKHPDPNVVCIPLTDSMKYWDIALAWNKDRYMSNACRLFLDFVLENLPPDDL